MSEQDKIIKQEFDSIIEDIKNLYNASGKRTSGEFEKGMEVTQTTSTTTLLGYPYLSGRMKGKMPPVENIKKWIEGKGITPLKGNITSLAWAIAKKIAKEGTSKEYHLKVYEEVITPQRIDDIIKKVSVFNVNMFTNELITELNILQKNV